MTENDCRQATPHADLMSELMDSCHPKSEREHAAVREIERLRARVAELEAAQAWKSVDSAPADCDLLLYCPDRGPTNEARIELRPFKNTRGGSMHAWATHWMPLPKGPEES